MYMSMVNKGHWATNWVATGQGVIIWLATAHGVITLSTSPMSDELDCNIPKVPLWDVAISWVVTFQRVISCVATVQRVLIWLATVHEVTSWVATVGRFLSGYMLLFYFVVQLSISVGCDEQMLYYKNHRRHCYVYVTAIAIKMT